MKAFKLNRDVPPGGYMQFWTGKKPPTLIITRFPKPDLPIRLITKVHSRGEFVEFVYDHKF